MTPFHTTVLQLSSLISVSYIKNIHVYNQNEGSFTGYYYPAWAKTTERISHFLPVPFEIKRL